jgi:D-alanyl-D-alanine carboxypeptidase (penicillin-binding protein 5/6)
MRTYLFAVLVTFAGLAAADDVAVPTVDAKAYYLMDASTGTVLAESNATTQLSPASLTKLMTAYLAFEALENGSVGLHDPVTISEKAWRAPGSRMFIEVDTEVELDDLLHGLIIQSGNDAAIAIAEYLAGSEDAFVEKMNQTAASLGMDGTTYRNTNGLPASGHVSTARDMALLAQTLIERFPQYYSLYSQREFTYNQITQHNRNALLWRDANVDGLKTGYTASAGYCLVSSAEREGMRLIAVVFGATTADARTETSLALLNYGFDAYETHTLYTRGQAVARADVDHGATQELPLGPAADVVVTVPRGEYEHLAATAVLTSKLTAPLDRDQVVGQLEISLGDEPITTLPLIALQAVAEGRILSRVAGWFD